MSNNRYFFLCVSFLLLGNSCFAQLDTFFVFAKSGLRLRDQPNREGKVITAIPYGAAVASSFITNYEKSDTVDQIPGSWTSVTFDGKEGYLFDGYLSPFPAPTAKDTTLMAYIIHHGKKTGKPITFENNEEEDYVSLEIQYYTLNNFLVCAKQTGYYEGYEESLSFDGETWQVSLSNLYLLFANIYKKEIEASKLRLKNGDFELTAPLTPETYFLFRDSDTESLNYEFYTDDGGYQNMFMSAMPERDRFISYSSGL